MFLECSFRPFFYTIISPSLLALDTVQQLPPMLFFLFVTEPPHRLQWLTLKYFPSCLTPTRWPWAKHVYNAPVSLGSRCQWNAHTFSHPLAHTQISLLPLPLFHAHTPQIPRSYSHEVSEIATLIGKDHLYVTTTLHTAQPFNVCPTL